MAGASSLQRNSVFNITDEFLDNTLNITVEIVFFLFNFFQIILNKSRKFIYNKL